jgi:5'(3')-deoxyribonucleotidase
MCQNIYNFLNNFLFQTKMKPKLSTDLDGVVCDFNKAFHNWVNNNLGRNLTYEGQNSYNYHECWGGTYDFWENLMIEFCQEKDSIRNLPVISEAVEGLNKLSKTYDLVATTFRNPLIFDGTSDWVSEHLPFVSQIAFEEDKADFCYRINAVAHIEDSLKCVKSFNNGTIAYLIDRPWNQGDYHKRVFSWDEILKEL